VVVIKPLSSESNVRGDGPQYCKYHPISGEHIIL
jgi:hypothetical protein